MAVDVLVTGGAGFIGSNLVRRLVANGRGVRVLDDLSTGCLANLQGLEAGLDFMEGDIRDRAAVERGLAGIRDVFHVAALASVERSVRDPLGTHAVNVDGTLGLLAASRDASVDRFVFSSSSSVYGDTPTLPKHEGMTPAPLSPYAVQKLAGECYCGVFCRLYGLKTFVLRYFNVFGPRQDPHSQYSAVIPLFIAALREGRAPVIHGDGRQTRDFTYVDDVVAANLACLGAPETAAGEVYNVACGNRISVSELAGTLCRIMDARVEPVHDEPRPGDVRDSQGSNARARQALDWTAEMPFEEGLRKTVAFFAKEGSP